MWRGLTSILPTLTEIAALLREQNSLIRELLQAQGRPATTLPSPASHLPPPRPRGQRIFTGNDVVQVTRQMLLQQQLRAAHPEPPATATEEQFFDRPVMPLPTVPLPSETPLPDPNGSAPTASATAAPAPASSSDK